MAKDKGGVVAKIKTDNICLPSHYEVEWLDEQGDGHCVNFSLDREDEMNKLIKVVEPLCMMLALYRIYKERL